MKIGDILDGEDVPEEENEFKRLLLVDERIELAN